MNDQSLTRRDVVALFVYVFIGLNTLSRLLGILSVTGLSHFSPFSSSPLRQTLDIYTIIIDLIPLFWVPFASLIATSISGRYPREITTSKAIRSLITPCVGLGLFFLSFPGLLQALYSLYVFSLQTPTSTSIASMIRANYFLAVADSLIRVSLGFALAFFPAIFDSLRHRMRDDPTENAA